MDSSWKKYFGFYAMWWSLLGTLGVVTLAFRMVKTSSLSQTFRLEDIPFLAAIDDHYNILFWGLAGLSVVGAAFAVFVFTAEGWRVWSRRAMAIAQVIVATIFVFQARAAGESLANPELHAVGVADWMVVVLYLGASILATKLFQENPIPPRPLPARRAMPRTSMIFLLTGTVLLIGALLEHRRFWDDHLLAAEIPSPTLVSFFDLPQGHEAHWLAALLGSDGVGEANLHFLTTSMLFVSLIALICVLGYRFFRRFVSQPAEAEGLSNRVQVRAAAAFALLWCAALSFPWLIKLWPEIKKDGAWLFPISILSVQFGSMLVLIFAAYSALVSDFTPKEGARPRWRPSDLGFLAFSMSALYPVLRLVLPTQRSPRLRAISISLLWVIAAGTMVGMALLAAYASEWFDFDDWRNMLKQGLFPTLRIAFTLAGVWAAYSLVGVIGRMWIAKRTEGGFDALAESTPVLSKGEKAGKVAILVTTALAFATASFPFWGASSISLNTRARSAEFNDRHAFELSFMHSLFDLDRDGYSVVLAGSDPDDFDASVQGFGMTPIASVPVAEPKLVVVDEARAKAMPNVVLLYLEGFTSESLNFFGKREISPAFELLPEHAIREDLVAVKAGHRSPTPFMDDIALRGTAFAHCRSVYPSTWDGWMQSQSGKHMMVTEFSTDALSKDHYSRFNVIDKTLRAVGFNRFCYGNSSPYAKLFVANRFESDDFEHDFDSDPNDEEEDRDIWKGDKQTDRILRFIESLEGSDRFFISEHMEDGHFPWKRTSDDRARIIGKDVNYHYSGSFGWTEFGGRSDSHQGFLQEVTRIDSQIGRITNALKAKGLWENTAVIILGDHGCQWYEHRHRYYVSHLYDQAITPPFFMKVPGYGPQAIVRDNVQQADLAPTLMELAGVEIENADAYRPDGKSLLPYLKGEANNTYRDEVSKRSMLLKTHYDLVGYLHEGRYKLITDRPTGTVMLFDLEKDPKELTNLADTEPALLADMIKRMADMSRDKMALLAGPSPPAKSEE
ncbi:MAG: sulfatase-like hydrolase/transferase [Planctomycetes bacterium]|nr:sulfatase-like hydrolase/transferase [Planctomycetota bacterium]